ncbi:MAG: FAD-dependent oxidoreductase [Deltaproteobacteria bacterium]|nr:FAD-dependent oxidoreductase [Deltaproteobacteria bacterium]
MSDSERKNVVVVGAGLAGLAAAWRLKRAGHEVSVLERRDRIGGGVGGEWVDDFCLDRSLHTLHSGNVRLLAWIDELGLRGELLPLRPLQITQVNDGRAQPIDPQSLGGVAQIPGVRWRDAARLVRWARLTSRYAPMLDLAAPERAASLDFRSVADFIRLYFGPSVLERWVAPEVTDTFAADEHELSRVTALLLWKARATGCRTSVCHGTMRRGLDSLVNALNERLSIRREVEVVRVDEVPSGGFSLVCQGHSGGRGELEADAVVLATSAVEAGRIAHLVVSPAERDFLAGVQQSAEVTLVLALDHPPSGLPQRIRVPHCEDLPMDSVVLEPGIAGGRAPVGAGLASVRATERFARANASAPDDVLAKGLLHGLARLLPGLEARVHHQRLYRRVDGAARFEVGAYRALDRFRRVEADLRKESRRLYYAGDYLIGPGPESALISGERAARDLLSDHA